MADKSELVAVAGKQVAVSNPDKIYFAGPGHTKRDLVAYYLAVAAGPSRSQRLKLHVDPGHLFARLRAIARPRKGAVEPLVRQGRIPGEPSLKSRCLLDVTGAPVNGEHPLGEGVSRQHHGL